MSLGILGHGRAARPQRAIRGLGAAALGATIPAKCWDTAGFKDCNAKGWDVAESKCRQSGQPTALANQKYGGSVDACKQAEADDYAYFGCALRLCPPATVPSPKTYNGWTWMSTTANSEIKTFQDHVNQAITAQGYKPITADGRLGPATCGAFNFVDMAKYQSLFAKDPVDNLRICQSFVNPTKVGQSKPVPSPTSPEGAELDKQFGGLPWMVADARVAGLQQQINRALDDNGFLPIPVSGMLDPQTCGAMIFLDQATGSVLLKSWGPRGGGACPSAIAPTRKPVPVVAKPTVTPTTTAPAPAEASSAGGMGALGVGLLAAAVVGGVVWWKSKTGGA